MDQTQLYIIRQSSVKTAFDFTANLMKSCDDKYKGVTSKDALALARRIEEYVKTGQ